MKFFLPCTIFCLSAGLLSGANQIPNGDLEGASAPKPYLRKFMKDGKDSPLLKTGFITEGNGNHAVLLESAAADGITEINFSEIKGLETEKNYYLVFQFNPLSFEPGARVSCRISFFDADAKLLNHNFSPSAAVLEQGVQDFIHSFRVPAKTAKAMVTLWFGGIQKTVADNFFLDRNLPVTPTADGNLLRNGSFETPAMIEYYIVPKIEGKTVSGKDQGMSAERDTLKKKTGKYALLCSSAHEKATFEINLNMLPFQSGEKYRFTAHYFIGSAEGKIRVAGRVTFWDDKGKVIRYLFPEGDISPGKWQEMKLEFYPPAGTARITISLWLTGKIQVWLDDIYYGIVKEKSISNRNAGAALLMNSDSFTLWKEAPYLKVPEAGMPEGLTAAKGVTLSAAANETEPFQLVVTPRKKLSGVRLLFSDLKGEQDIIPASELSYKIVGFIFLKNPDNPSLKGWNADPLLPETSANAEPGKNLPFYVTVQVPKDRKAGLYRGNIRIMDDSGELGSIPLNVRVRNFALPEVPYLKTYFYAQPFAAYKEIDQRPHAEIADNLQRILQEHRMTGNQAQWPPRPTWKIENDTLTITDWTAFDERVRKWHDQYGMRSIPAPIFTMMGDNDGWWGGDRSKPPKSPFGNFSWDSPEGLQYAGEFAKQFTDHVKKTFPDINFYAYLYDEPPAKVHAVLSKITNELHKAAPDLKIFIPKHVSRDIGYVYAWSVPFAPGFLHPELQKAELAAGHEIWYYNWAVRLDSHEYIRTRLYPWQIFSADGSGGLLWNTIFTPKGINPWTDMDKTHACGGATIFYPPRKPGEGIIASLRSAQIRESIDDFDYMRILEKKIDARFPGQGTLRVKEILHALLPDAPFGYKNDPHLMYSLRDRIADEIESLDSEPAVVITSTPPDNASTDLSEVRFHVSGPDGAAVLLNGKEAGKIGPEKCLDIPFVLGKLGENKVSFRIVSNGKEKELVRSYDLKPDPQLKELHSLLAKCEANGVNAGPIREFLSRIERQKAYTAAERSDAKKMIETAKYEIVAKAIAGEKQFVNALEKGMYECAKNVFLRKQFERAEYYLELSREAAKAGNMKDFQVKITSVDYEGHPALLLDNGIIRATVMETGGRVISFKVRGIECLAPGTFENALSPAERSARKVTKEMVTKLRGYGGYEDAGGDSLWPVSFVDWNIRFLELKPDRIALSFETRIPDTPFLFRRTLSLRANSEDLKMDYEIMNTMPKGTESDDPEHYQLAWRGRFMPAVGNSKNAQENDRLVLPVKEADLLSETCFTSSKPAAYERRSIKLAAPWMGSFDPALKTGLLILGGPATTHAYVWFNSKGDHKGEGKVYTLEFPRSFYGKAFNDPEANKPLTIKPGESVNFTVILRGVSGAETEQQFLESLGKSR